MIRIHLLIEGRVQGVGFRDFAVRRANQLGLHGWVRNIPNDGVEIISEGEEVMINEFILACKHGPSRAYVTEIKIDYRSPTHEFKGFSRI